MKYVILLIAMFVLCGCGSKQTPDEMESSCYRDTIIGNFSGSGIDTLVCEPIDTTIADRDLWTWKISSVGGSVESLVLDKRFSVKMVYEGDLDGNGTDEFGVRREISHGTWDNYFIYTYNCGEWKLLTEPIWTYQPHFDDELNHGKDVAEPTENKGIIRIRRSETNENGDIILKDTLIKAEMQPIAIILEQEQK